MLADATLRLFLAVLLPDEVRTPLDRAIAPLTLDGREVRWVARDLWHLTLVFLGERPASQAPAILTAGRAASSVAPFSLQLGGTGCFPSPVRPRVLWVGAVAGADRLLALQRTVQTTLVAAGLAEPDTRFSAHLTVGRLRDQVAPTRLAALGAQWSAQQLPFLPPFTVRSVALMQSVLGRGGPRYTALHTIPLAAPMHA
jgi:2'-5' RNA ligase